MRSERIDAARAAFHAAAEAVYAFDADKDGRHEGRADMAFRALDDAAIDAYGEWMQERDDAALSAPAPQAEAGPKAGAGEAVAWGVRSYDGALVIAFVGERAEWTARNYPLPSVGQPYEATPLYAHPAPASPAMAVVEAAWTDKEPAVPGHYLYIDAHHFDLHAKYPTVATPPIETVQPYEIVMGSGGPVARYMRAGQQREFSVRGTFHGGVWFGPLPLPTLRAAQEPPRAKPYEAVNIDYSHMSPSRPADGGEGGAS